MSRVDRAPMHPQLGRVFISSVFRGLKELREMAAEAIGQLGFEAVLTERLLASDTSVADSLEREIRHCDTYVGLFSRRRGTVPAGELWAITEQEFRWATDRGLRRLVFFEDLPEAERDPELTKFLNDHVGSYRTGIYAVPYADEANLRRKLAASLAQLRPMLVWAIDDDGTSALFAEGVRPAWREEPEALAHFEVEPTLSADAQATVRALLVSAESRSQVKESSLVLAGRELGALLSPAAATALDGLLDRSGEMHRPLVLRIRSRRRDVLALPWELLSTPNHELPVKDGKLEIVREIARAGTVMQPADDPAQAQPRLNLEILGFTADPIEDHTERSGVGADAGGYDSSLFWEHEQERLLIAVEPLMRAGTVRLTLPDTGDAALLREELSSPDSPGVVHLSCHGGPIERDGKTVQALILEDAEGHQQAVTADDLLVSLRAGSGEWPEMMVLSACYTAAAVQGIDPHGRGAGAPVARPMADELVLGGVKRVLGMQSSVSDAGATEMAGAIYGAIARGGDVPMALRAGRAALRAEGGLHEWAIPVLVQGGGLSAPLVVAPTAQTAVETPFAAARASFDVAGVSYLDHGYIGRRDFERRLRRAWVQGARFLVIHGLGGIGKSTMAARFLETRRNEGVRTVVLRPGPHDAGSLLDEVAEGLRVQRPTDVEPPQVEEAFRGLIREELRSRRTIVLFDNFEDNQDPETGALVESGGAGPGQLASAICELAHLAGLGVCLLFTSRFAFELPEEETTHATVCLDLGAFSRAEARKFRATMPGLGSLDEAAWQTLLGTIGGHPKALELMDGYVRASADRAANLIARLSEAVGSVDRKLRATRQERGRALFLDKMIEAVPAARRAALDRASLLFTSLPTKELVELLQADGVASGAEDVEWLRRRGLLARTVSGLTGNPEDAVHGLIAERRCEALPEEERREFHRRVGEHLRQRPGRLADLGIAARHHDAAGDRTAALACYVNWTAALNRRHGYAAAVAKAAEGLARFAPETDEARCQAARLYCQVATAQDVMARPGDADSALDQAEALLARVPPKSASFEVGSVALRRADQARTKGDLDRSVALARIAASAFKEADASRDRAIALGKIADVLYARGELDEALRIRREEELPVYEKLGDVRERAVTLGKIADVLDARGELDEAIDHQNRTLELCRRSGFADGIASAQLNLAGLELKAGKPEHILERLQESWSISLKLGRPDGIAFVGHFLGALLHQIQHPQAKEILQLALEAARKIGNQPLIDAINELLAS